MHHFIYSQSIKQYFTMKGRTRDHASFYLFSEHQAILSPFKAACHSRQHYRKWAKGCGENLTVLCCNLVLD
jgi:hypothetical protein